MYFLSIQFTKIVITQFFWDLNIVHPLLIIKIDFTKISEALGGCIQRCILDFRNGRVKINVMVLKNWVITLKSGFLLSVQGGFTLPKPLVVRPRAFS